MWVFLPSPVLVFTLGPLRVWPVLLVALLALTGAIAVSYFRAHRRLFPELSYDRWMNALSMAVLPLSAMRGADKFRELPRAESEAVLKRLHLDPVQGSASRGRLRVVLPEVPQSVHAGGRAVVFCVSRRSTGEG